MKHHKLQFLANNSGVGFRCYVIHCPKIVRCEMKEAEFYESYPNNIFEVYCPFCKKYDKECEKVVRGKITGIFLKARKKQVGI